MNICVFCSAQDVPQKYQDAAREFATLIGKNGHTLVWGGSNVGTMKAIADAAQEAGGKIIGIDVEFLRHKARPNADEMIFTTDLSERKALLLDRSDVIVVLSGGIGTLDEATDVIALRRHGKHNKPVVFLNTEGFYEGMKTQLERMDKEGFLGNRDGDVVAGLAGLVYFADTPKEAMRYIEENGN
ncbi:MAG TPA: TIGR00730 family Rossman fold protein [Candidatus Paceibacterota bacterium]